MSYRHMIVLSSSYKLGKRIAYHVAGQEYDDFNILDALMEKDEFKFCTIYNIVTDDNTWKSVKEYDPFYVDMQKIDDMEEFIGLIAENKDISVIDLSQYIIVKLQEEKINCTHLKLQKLAYFCYELYLLRYRKKLFKEKIYAWKRGPVIKYLYNTIKRLNKGEQYQLRVHPDLELYDIRQRIIFFGRWFR